MAGAPIAIVHGKMQAGPLTNGLTCGIVSVEKVLPADGQPSELVSCDRTLWTEGRSLLVFVHHKDANNANDQYSNLDQVGVCNHEQHPLSFDQGQKLPPKEGQTAYRYW